MPNPEVAATGLRFSLQTLVRILAASAARPESSAAQKSRAVFSAAAFVPCFLCQTRNGLEKRPSCALRRSTCLRTAAPSFSRPGAFSKI